MKRLLRDNGLSFVLIGLFLGTYLGGQVFSGWKAHNEELVQAREPPLTWREYLTSAHFIEATTENWESEFLQMFLYVFITAFLFQRGSAESNDPDEPEEKRPVTKASPWPVRKGGWVRALYNHSLSLAFAVLFLASFWTHAVSSARLENEERARQGKPAVTFAEHIAGAKFWFESFQNWQSEFLAIGSMVILSIFLREKGSPESKAVEAPHVETGG
ncbi:MAG TPA: DUF6766 family protein [Lacunisphaera sp.]